jgi:hypothetical protein
MKNKEFATAPNNLTRINHQSTDSSVFILHSSFFFVSLQPIMTPEEFVQLKAFARQDGALLSLLWIGALVCYVQGLTSPLLGMTALLLIVLSPLFAANRLRHFRDYAREGFITFRRGYAYTILIFFYGGLLLAAALYVYFAFIDQGYLLGKLTEMMHTAEGEQAIQAYGMQEEMEQGLRTLTEMRPIDFALNMLSINIMTGFFLGIPIAAAVRKLKVEN